jgi:UDP-N-acetylmuramate-alanine ligase
MDTYITAFNDADHVLVTAIYGAREKPVLGMNIGDIVANMAHPDARYTLDRENTVAILDEEVQAPAVILIMSAGDAPQIGIDYLQHRRVRLGIPDEQ